jgi:hypothetical protein
MPVVARLSNATINVCFGGEAPPHFYVRGPNSDVMIDIETLKATRGLYQRSDHAEAIAWAAVNLDLMLRTWSECNERD